MNVERRQTLYARVIKRILDLVLALLGSVLLLLPVAVIALLVRCRLGAPVLFRQERPGRDGKIFRLCKFRTMTDAKDGAGNLLPDAERLTPFGRKLRALSLDELPELWNILRGDMSFVGPRPLLKKYLPLYSAEQNRRHEVRPGITGLAQVNGRNLVGWQDRFRYDVYYVDHISFMMDLRILFRTVAAVFRKEGITSATSETMEEFQGNEEGGEST